MAHVLLVLAAIGLAVYALVDMSGSDEKRRAGLPKGLWIVLIIFLPYVGAIAWILMKYATQSGAGGGPAARVGGLRRPQPGPLAPDDDPDFLWQLEQQRRNQDRASGPAKPASADGAATDTATSTERASGGPTARAAADSDQRPADPAERSGTDPTERTGDSTADPSSAGAANDNGSDSGAGESRVNGPGSSGPHEPSDDSRIADLERQFHSDEEEPHNT